MTLKCGMIIYNKSNQRFCLVFGRKSKKWGFPKGHQEDNENDEMTAKRELFEETGYELHDQISLKKKFFVKNNVYFEIILDDDQQVTQKQNGIPDRNEIERVQWFNISEILALGIENCNFGLKTWILKRRYNKQV